MKNIKKFIYTIFTFLATNLVCAGYYLFLLVMLAMSTDSGVKSLSVYILKDFTFLFAFSTILGLMGVLPHIIVFFFLKKKEFLSKKLYLFLGISLFLIIFASTFDTHGNFSKEMYEERILEIREEEGFITEKSFTYKLCHRYLQYNDKEQIKIQIKNDKIMLDKNFDEIIGRINVIEKIEYDEIYYRLNINREEVVRETPQRQMILNVFNEFENNNLTIEEFKSELNAILETKVKAKYIPNKVKDSLRLSIQTDLTYIDMYIDSNDDYMKWILEKLEYCIKDEYEYNSDLVNSSIYRDYIKLLTNYTSLEELEISMKDFGSRHGLNYKNEMIKDILDRVL